MNSVNISGALSACAFLGVVGAAGAVAANWYDVLGPVRAAEEAEAAKIAANPYHESTRAARVFAKIENVPFVGGLPRAIMATANAIKNLVVAAFQKVVSLVKRDDRSESIANRIAMAKNDANNIKKGLLLVVPGLTTLVQKYAK